MPISPYYNPAIDSRSKTFKTHLNYLKCVNHLTDNLAITINNNICASLNSNIYGKFDKLSKITKKSIDGELTACNTEPAYAQVAAPWIPVKCYYYLYYLESTFIYLLDGSMTGFGPGGHLGIRRAIKNIISNGSISFIGTNAQDFCRVTTWDSANHLSTTRGANLRADYHTTNNCKDSLQKKLAVYMEFDWRLKNNIKNYRKVADRNKRQTDLYPKLMGPLDYFYWMRIKANYRDIDFLDFDNDVNEQDALTYLDIYISTAYQYAHALNIGITVLKQMRNIS